MTDKRLPHEKYDFANLTVEKIEEMAKAGTLPKISILPPGQAKYTEEEAIAALTAMVKVREKRRKADQEYFDTFHGDPSAVLEEIDRILYGITREKDFFPYVDKEKAEAREYLKILRNPKKFQSKFKNLPPEVLPYIVPPKELVKEMQEHYYRNYVSFYNFLFDEITMPIKAWLHFCPGDYDTIIEHVQKRATDPKDGYRIRKAGIYYQNGVCRISEDGLAAGKREKIEPELQIFSDGDPMGFTSIFQGPGTNQLALFNNSKKGMRRIDPKEDIWSKRSRSGDYELKIKGNLSVKVGCIKLLFTAQALLNHQNQYGNSKTSPNLTVKIPLKDYIEKNRKKVTDDNIKNMRKKIDSYLDVLFEASLSWKEPSKGKKKGDYRDIRIIVDKGIQDGHIVMTFSEPLGVYLISSYVSQFPLGALLAIDELYHPMAVPIFQKLALHHSNDRNAKQGTNNILKTTTIMEACGDYLPTYEEVITSNDRHVDRRISDRVIKELNYLQDQGWIHWHFCNAKNTELDPDQLDLINDDGFCPYDLFKDLRICFEIVGAPDQSERRQRNDEKKAKQQDRLDKALAQQKAKQILKEGK